MGPNKVSLKNKLANLELTLGSWITLAHPAIAEIMAKAGFSWLTVDLEHSVITIREAEELIRTIDHCGAAPLVRLSANDPVQIKRVMDAGSYGIIVPMVNSAAEARRAVEAVQYPPAGQRGFGLARAQGYGNDFTDYLNWVKKETVVIVQIESIEAVRNLKDILSVEGVDGFMIGPYDLSGSLGIPGQFNHPLMIETLKDIYEIGRTSGKAPGIHIVEPDRKELKDRVEQEFRFIAYSVDIRMLDHMCQKCMIDIGSLKADLNLHA